MAKKKEVEVVKIDEGVFITKPIEPITESFGGNMDILRDKINEIITRG